jgi:hypothetical protein
MKLMSLLALVLLVGIAARAEEITLFELGSGDESTNSVCKKFLFVEQSANGETDIISAKDIQFKDAADSIEMTFSDAALCHIGPKATGSSPSGQAQNTALIASLKKSYFRDSEILFRGKRLPLTKLASILRNSSGH